MPCRRHRAPATPNRSGVRPVVFLVSGHRLARRANLPWRGARGGLPALDLTVILNAMNGNIPANSGAVGPADRAAANLGELHPVGGGDPIPLLKPMLVIGRRENCDIILRFANVSGAHCKLSLDSGWWYVRDLKSSNGTKVNGERVTERRLAPGDKLSVAKHHFDIHYDPAKLGSTATILDDDLQDVFSRSLLDSAGLEHRRPAAPPAAPPRRPRT